MKTRNYRPHFECLEQRLPPSANLLEASSPDEGTTEPVAEVATTTESDVEVVDPTLDPVDPANTTISVQVTELGDPVNGQLQSITVQGLSGDNLDFAVIQVQVGDTVYNVDFITIQADGQVTLTVTSGINPNDVAVGDTVSVITGDGGATTIQDEPEAESLPAEELQSDVPIVDPTLEPVG